MGRLPTLSNEISTTNVGAQPRRVRNSVRTFLHSLPGTAYAMRFLASSSSRDVTRGSASASSIHYL